MISTRHPPPAIYRNVLPGLTTGTVPVDEQTEDNAPQRVLEVSRRRIKPPSSNRLHRYPQGMATTI